MLNEHGFEVCIDDDPMNEKIRQGIIEILKYILRIEVHPVGILKSPTLSGILYYMRVTQKERQKEIRSRYRWTEDEIRYILDIMVDEGMIKEHKELFKRGAIRYSINWRWFVKWY